MEKEMEAAIERLRRVRAEAALGGGAERIARQHEKGKLTARERIDLLLDPGSFVETDSLVEHTIGAPGDGVVAGHGTIDGRVVCLFSQDATIMGGSIGGQHGRKIYKTLERAVEMGVPFIGLNDSPGARAERMDRPGYQIPARDEKYGASIFFQNTEASGVIPQISAILGSCAGISVYSPALTDFIFMVDGISQMFITGPRIVKSVTYEDITMEELGGAKVHTQVSGVADFRVRSEKECFQRMRKLLSFLPSNNREAPPAVKTEDDPYRRVDAMAEIVPTDSRKPYDMHKIITSLVDNGDFFEVKEEFAREMIVGFGRLEGCTVGIVANQPMVLGGALTVNSSDKQSRFIRFCDCFNIPLVFLADCPAYFPGSAQENAGIIRHGAKVLYALCEAVVPRITVILRKCYGGAQLGMGVIAGLGTDFVFAWPIAEMGVLGAEQSVELFYAEDLRKAENPEEFRRQKTQEYRETFANPFIGASMGVRRIDEIIEPGETRSRLISTLQLMRGKRAKRLPKRHGNIPL